MGVVVYKFVNISLLCQQRPQVRVWAMHYDFHAKGRSVCQQPFDSFSLLYVHRAAEYTEETKYMGLDSDHENAEERTSIAVGRARQGLMNLAPKINSPGLRPCNNYRFPRCVKCKSVQPLRRAN